MTTLQRLNDWAGRNLFYLLLGALGAALLVGEAAAPLRTLSPYLLAFTMFVATSRTRVADYVRVLRLPRAVFLSMALFYLWVPAVGMGLARLLANDPHWLAAYLLLWLGPSATISSVWTDLAGGNVALSASLTGLTVFVSSVVLPPLFSAWTAAVGRMAAAPLYMEPAGLWGPLLLYVLAPAVAGVAVNDRFGGLLRRAAAPLGLAGKAAILVIVAINAAGVTPYLGGSIGGVLGMALVTLVTEVSAYALGVAAGRRWLGRAGDATAVAYVSTMRNTVLALTMAGFNLAPTAVLPGVVALMVQEPLAVLAGRFLGQAAPAAARRTAAPIRPSP